MRVAEVLRRIREFIRRRAPERELVNLNTIVADALQFTRLERRQHGVSVTLRPDHDLQAVEADGVQITQVLVNLLSNSIHAISEFMLESPRITITTQMTADGQAEVIVADNGPGIAADDLPKIFDRFYSTKSSGLGLGLPISRSIVEGCGGTLTCDSKPGESAVFRLKLPTAKASVPKSKPSASTSRLTCASTLDSFSIKGKTSSRESPKRHDKVRISLAFPWPRLGAWADSSCTHARRESPAA